MTDDPAEFSAAAREFLASRPVEHTLLLTETAFLVAHPEPGAAQRYGWWQQGGVVAGAFVQGPRHRALLSPMPREAVEGLASRLAHLPPMGVDGGSTGAAVEAWRDRCGVELRELARFTLSRLGHAPTPAPGRARTATPADRDRLVAWFDDLKAAHPDDPSDLAFVVDDPLAAGAMVVLDDDAGPVAMASRTPVVAGMTRMGAVWPPGRAGDEAFAAACGFAAAAAKDVLVLTSADDASGRYRELGFDPVLDRVVLGPVTG